MHKYSRRGAKAQRFLTDTSRPRILCASAPLREISWLSILCRKAPKACFLFVCIAFVITPSGALAQPRDPAWGSDHIGKPLPEFASGDECLFCHRDVGPG